MDQKKTKTKNTSRSYKVLLKHRLLGHTPGVSDSVGLGWALRICIFNKFPGNAEVAGPGIIF